MLDLESLDKVDKSEHLELGTDSCSGTSPVSTDNEQATPKFCAEADQSLPESCTRTTVTTKREKKRRIRKKNTACEPNPKRSKQVKRKREQSIGTCNCNFCQVGLENPHLRPSSSSTLFATCCAARVLVPNRRHKSDKKLRKQLHWPIPLDKELFDWITSQFPAWFADFSPDLLTAVRNGIKMDEEMISAFLSPSSLSREDEDRVTTNDDLGAFEESYQTGHVVEGQTSPGGPHGSPQATVDETSLQKERDKNKLSLKVKLMLRRPVNQLVDQGIMPPPKTPSAFFEQRRHLERARTGDILKTKIQKRPDRQELVQQHILEDTKIAPSLHDRQRKLKRAKLADYLNDKIAHRPGPLELVQGNILKLSSYNDNDGIANPVIDGSISFKKSSEREVTQAATEFDNEFVTDEDDGSSSASSPTGGVVNSKDIQVKSPGSVSVSAASTPLSLDSSFKAPSPSTSLISSSSCPSPQQLQQNLIDARRRTNSLVQVPDSSTAAANVANNQGYPGSVASSSSSSLSSSAIPPLPNSHNGHRRSKKCRVKAPIPQKSRTIKFHEYKGPAVVQSKTQSKNITTYDVAAASASASKASSLSAAPQHDSQTNYHIILEQQQLLLKWELECQRRSSAKQQEPQGSSQSQQQQQKVEVDVPASPIGQHQQLQQQNAPSADMNRSAATQRLTLTFPAQSQIPPAPAHLPPPGGFLLNITTQSTTADTGSTTTDDQRQQQLPQPPPAPPPEEKPPRRPSKPDDLKVADLKIELKKRSLPVSGSKTHLLERLKNYLSANPDDSFGAVAASSPPSQQNLSVESPPEIKLESDHSSHDSVPEPTPKPFELPSMRPTQQLSFMQLDPLQQQQATAIALQTLAMQLPCATAGPGNTPLIPQIQNLHISQMEVDQQQQQPRPVPQQTVHTLPTIFLATSQTTGTNQVHGVTFQSTPLQVQQSPLPYIITMNGLNSTLNLINGFNINAVINDSQKQQQQQQQQQAAESEQTSTQKLQQHLYQKLLMQQQQQLQQQQQKELKPQQQFVNNVSFQQTGSDNQSLNMQVFQDTGMQQMSTDCPMMSYNRHNGCSEAMVTDENPVSRLQTDDKNLVNSIKTEDTGNCFGHSSYPFTNGFKSEAIDDVLEILIRDGELPASAAENALPEDVISQHTRPMSHSCNGFYEPRKQMNQQNVNQMGQQTHNNTFPLPPISSISPANHGSPGSACSSSESAEMTAMQNQLALLDYFNLSQSAGCMRIPTNQELLQQQQQQQQDQHSHMDYSSCEPSGSYSNNAMDTSVQQNSNQSMNEEEMHSLLNHWLTPFSDNNNSGDLMSDQQQQQENSFYHENSFPRQDDMSADAFHDSGLSMDAESFLGASSADFDSMFDNMLDLFSNTSGGPGNTGYLNAVTSLSGHNGPSASYWPESEQMLQ